MRRCENLIGCPKDIKTFCVMMVQSGENEGRGAVESEVQGGFVTCRSKRFMSVAFVAMLGSSKERAPLISQ